MKDLMPPIDTPDNTFRDGNPATGQQGDIVPALWLNNVQGTTRDTQKELISVLNEAGITIDPANSQQLLTALKKLFLQSSGVATSVQMQEGTSTTLIPSVAAVMSLFSKRIFAANDYIRIPDVPGGLIIQFGTTNNSTTNPQTVNLPIAFPTTGLVVVASDLSGAFLSPTSIAICSARFLSKSQIQTATAYQYNTLGPDSVQWVAIGY